MSAPPRRLLLVRHGLPDYRLRKSNDIPPGPVLSVIGHDQARQAAEVVAPYAPDAIHTSPLARTRQTAEWIARATRRPLRIEIGIKEWQRTESLSTSATCQARWLRMWLRGDERCAVAVSHASPILALIRTALYLPHFGWYVGRDPDWLRLDTCDRFEISMGSVFLLTFTAEDVTAERLLHPRPRVVNFRHGRITSRFPRPTGEGEQHLIRRRNWKRLIGWRHELRRLVRGQPAFE